MRKLLNTLYITQPDCYLAIEGENIIVRQDNKVMGRVPLHNLEAIVTFGYTGASPALMGYCAENGKALTFISNSGRFKARITGKVNGNVLLRRQQYRWADNNEISAKITRNILIGKLFNQKWVLERATRDHELRVDVKRLKLASGQLKKMLEMTQLSNDLDQLRGYEGQAAVCYFSVFNELILQQNNDFVFTGRTRRPPLDRVNALLSFAYTLLANDCASAAETVGLDSYVGFFHQDRPGRISLALDLMEDLRSVLADRFVITLINKKIIQAKHFIVQKNEAVILTDDGRKKFITNWQKKKSEMLVHPFLGEKIEWGLVPYVQALLLARYIRGDLDQYPPFLWK